MEMADRAALLAARVECEKKLDSKFMNPWYVYNRLDTKAVETNLDEVEHSQII